MAQLFTTPRFTPLSYVGGTIPGAELYFYNAGTSALRSIYADTALTTPLSNPVTSDSSGTFPAIWLQDTLYSVEMRDEDGQLLWREDLTELGGTSSIIVGYLTRDSVVLPADSEGGVSDYSSASGTYKITANGTDVSDQAIFSVLDQTSCTGSISSDGTYQVTAVTADVAAISFRAYYDGQSIDRVFSLVKAKSGASVGSNLVINGSGEYGNSTNWNGLDKNGINYTSADTASSGGPTDGPYLTVTNSVQQTVATDLKIPYVRGNSYEINAWMRGTGSPVVYAGVVCLNSSGTIIRHCDSYRIAGANTTLYADATVGQSYIDIVPPSTDWSGISLPCVQYAILTDNSDLPVTASTTTRAPSFTVDKTAGTYWRVTFPAGYTVPASYSAGTNVSVSEDGRVYTYCLASDETLGGWTYYRSRLFEMNAPTVAPTPETLRRGTAYLVPVFVTNHTAISGAVTDWTVAIADVGTAAASIVPDSGVRFGSGFWEGTGDYLVGGGNAGDALVLDSGEYVWPPLATTGIESALAYEGDVFQIRVRAKGISTGDLMSLSAYVVTVNAAGGEPAYSLQVLPFESGSTAGQWMEATVEVTASNGAYSGTRYVRPYLSLGGSGDVAHIDLFECRRIGRRGEGGRATLLDADDTGNAVLLESNGTMARGFPTHNGVVISSSTALTDTHIRKILYVNTSAGNVTLTVSNTTGYGDGKDEILIFKHTSANTLTIATSGGAVLTEAPSTAGNMTVTGYGFVTLRSYGSSNWVGWR